MKKKILYKNPRFMVMEEEVNLPDGRKTKIPYVKRDNSTMILAVKDKKILLIKEYRAAIKSWIYELPGGKIEKNETPLDGAKRELEEETGYKVKRIVPMFHSSLNPSYIDQTHHFFFAELGEKKEQKLDRDELINIKFVTVEEALEMIRNGELIDLLSIAGILYYAQNRNELK